MKEVVAKMSEKTAFTFAPGLEGVVATRTRLSNVDGAAGRLVIAGFSVEELAGRASSKRRCTCSGTARCPTWRSWRP
jgi:citrate synthase